MKRIIKTAARWLRSLITRKQGPGPLKLRLAQEPRFISECGILLYGARAVDDEGNEYWIMWDVVEVWREPQDSSYHVVYSLDRGEHRDPWDVIRVHP